MNLLDLARADFDFLMSDGEVGQTERVLLKAPGGQSAYIQAIITDIGAGLDPSTGLTVTVSTASMVVSEAELARAGIGRPASTDDGLTKPWLVTVTRKDGSLATYKLAEPRPDRRMASVWYVLAHYKGG